MLLSVSPSRFGGTFHQSMLAILAKLGFLVPDDHVARREATAARAMPPEPSQPLSARQGLDSVARAAEDDKRVRERARDAAVSLKIKVYSDFGLVFPSPGPA
jgi:hypothetical protein